MHHSPVDTDPWYRQFWPWFLISIPLVTVIAGIAMILIASNKPDGLVVDDYYKQGLAINRRLEREQRAAQLGVTATGRIDLERRLVHVQLQGVRPLPVSMQLLLLHPTQAHKDQTITLQKQSDNGEYLGAVAGIAAGEWHIMLEPDDGRWRLSDRLRWPEQMQWQLAPKPRP